VEIAVVLLILLSCLCTLFGLFHNVTLQIPRYVLFSAFLPLTFSLWTTFLIDRFGYSHFGVLFAGGAISIGLVTFVDTPLINYCLRENSFFLGEYWMADF